MQSETKPVPEQDYVSSSGRKWRWCDVWQCWEHDHYTYKIFYWPADDFFTCSSHGVWHQGNYPTFDAVEREVLEG